jgi:hypothetical protein
MLTALMARARFGDPAKEKGMVLWNVPEHLQIGAVPRRIYCNRLLVDPLARAFRCLIDKGLIDELRTWDGCFNIRSKRSSASPSLHSWGLAVDLNAAWNAQGKPPTLSPGFVACFLKAGFDWGGSWARPDGMHFELSEEAFSNGS